MRETTLWVLHLVAGAGLVVLLGAHMAVQHFPRVLSAVGWVEQPVRGFASVAARSASPGWVVLYALLVVFAVYHGLYGLRRILHEAGWGPKAGRVVDVAVVVAGVALMVYGLVTAVQGLRAGGAL